MNKVQQRQVRHQRIAKKIKRYDGTPRLVVFRSNKFIYAQLIDDSTSKTLVAASNLKEKGEKKSKIEAAKEVGMKLAKEATAKKLTKVAFDRAGYKYHGRVKALAEGAKEGGLVF